MFLFNCSLTEIRKIYFATLIYNVRMGSIQINLIKTKIIALYKEIFVQTLMFSLGNFDKNGGKF